MNSLLRAVLHPMPEVGKKDTGLRYTDILFGFVIRELFFRLRNLPQLDWVVRWHLIVGAVLVLGSWIGFRRSLNRSAYEVKFFNLPLFRFVLDQMMLILYFRIATLTPVDGGDVVLRPDALARTTSELVTYILALYVLWDMLGIWTAKAKVTDGKPRYPKVQDDKQLDGVPQNADWWGFMISCAALLLAPVLSLVASCCNPNCLLFFMAALLVAYRWAKEIRTSCQSSQAS